MYLLIFVTDNFRRNSKCLKIRRFWNLLFYYCRSNSCRKKYKKLILPNAIQLTKFLESISH